ncbi:hypothetical protein UPYG_G00240040 [Umbra pygmaea]|uniref:Somatostatin/Cortistatin C-terminal domain-containing protein n=1 Tax=Umbra pygmaea TaxID=75934 RepID=A0ABD0WFY2_UMBPY
MLCSQLQVLLVALSLSAFLARASAAPHRDTLTDLLRGDTTKANKELSRALLLKILSDLMTTATVDEVLPDLDDDLDAREDVVRQLPLSQRERKVGCRNFFWKTFTSC